MHSQNMWVMLSLTLHNVNKGESIFFVWWSLCFVVKIPCNTLKIISRSRIFIYLKLMCLKDNSLLRSMYLSTFNCTFYKLFWYISPELIFGKFLIRVNFLTSVTVSFKNFGHKNATFFFGKILILKRGFSLNLVLVIIRQCHSIFQNFVRFCAQKVEYLKNYIT